MRLPHGLTIILQPSGPGSDWWTVEAKDGTGIQLFRAEGPWRVVIAALSAYVVGELQGAVA